MIHILRSSRSLAQVLILPFIILILVLSLLVGFLSYFAGRQAVISVADRMLLETVERVGLAVDRHVFGAAAVLETAFPNGLTAAADIDRDLTAMRSRFWVATSLHLDPNNYVYYGNRAGQFVGLYRHTMTDAELRVKYWPANFRSAYRFSSIDGVLSAPKNDATDFDPRLRPWYAAGKNAVSDVWSSIYINFWEKDLVATRARRVLDKHGEFQGVVATDVSLTALSDFMKNLHVSPHGIAFIIEPNGNLIASSESDIVAIDQDGEVGRLNAANSRSGFIRDTYATLQTRLAATENMGAAERNFTFDDGNGEPIYAAYSWIRDNAGLSWITVVAVPRSDFMDTLDKNARWTVVIAGIAILIALLLGLSIVHWVVRDVRRLSRAATRIGKGQMNVKLRIERRDEIGQLARNFMEMQTELSTDKLTGVTSRGALLRYLDAAIQSARKLPSQLPKVAAPPEVFTLLFLDLNRFKAINDKLGHQYGDLTLIEVGQRLREAVRENDIVARYGGDEFVIVCWGVADQAFAERLRTKLDDLLRPPLDCLKDVPGAQGMTVGTSIGVAFYPADGRDAETLIKLADNGMYENKAAGRRAGDR